MMSLRSTACEWLGRYPGLLLALGGLGMLGFIAADVALSIGVLGVTRYLMTVGVSLAAYGFALGVGYFGDPWELRRVQALAAEPHAETQQQPAIPQYFTGRFGSV
jgi:hypothetical protein